jgi:hypothetical protein
MRGDDQQLQTGMFSYVALEDRIPADHPLRGVRKLVDVVLAGMSRDFDGLYAQGGRPSIAPERCCERRYWCTAYIVVGSSSFLPLANACTFMATTSPLYGWGTLFNLCKRQGTATLA